MTSRRTRAWAGSVAGIPRGRARSGRRYAGSMQRRSRLSPAPRRHLALFASVLAVVTFAACSHSSGTPGGAVSASGTVPFAPLPTNVTSPPLDQSGFGDTPASVPFAPASASTGTTAPSKGSTASGGSGGHTGTGTGGGGGGGTPAPPPAPRTTTTSAPKWTYAGSSKSTEVNTAPFTLSGGPVQVSYQAYGQDQGSTTTFFLVEQSTGVKHQVAQCADHSCGPATIDAPGFAAHQYTPGQYHIEVDQSGPPPSSTYFWSITVREFK